MKIAICTLLLACAGCALPRGATVDVDTIGGGMRVDRRDAPAVDPLAHERDISACAGLHGVGSPEYCGCLRRVGGAGDHEYLAYCRLLPPPDRRVGEPTFQARGPPPPAPPPPPVEPRIAAVVETVVQHEGAPSGPYVDDASGRCHRAVGDAHPPPGTCDRLIANLLQADNAARRVAGDDLWASLSEPQRRALLMLGFGVGERGLAGFKRLWAALRGNYTHAAAAEVRDSLWCEQVGSERCSTVASMLTQ